MSMTLLAPNLNVGDRLLVKDDPVMLVLVGLGSTTAHEKFVGGLNMSVGHTARTAAEYEPDGKAGMMCVEFHCPP